MIPVVRKLGPPAFRRFLLEASPSADLQKIKDTVDVMTDTSNQIFQHKLRALRSGDEKLLQRMGAGKDIMSILREHLSIKWLRNLANSH